MSRPKVLDNADTILQTAKRVLRVTWSRHSVMVTVGQSTWPVRTLEVEHFLRLHPLPRILCVPGPGLGPGPAAFPLSSVHRETRSHIVSDQTNQTPNISRIKECEWILGPTCGISGPTFPLEPLHVRCVHLEFQNCRAETFVCVSYSSHLGLTCLIPVVALSAQSAVLADTCFCRDFVEIFDQDLQRMSASEIRRGSWKIFTW